MTLVTEKEAAEKWCPFSSVEGGTRFPPNTSRTLCIGSRCMAWRWTRIGMVFEHGEKGAIFRQQKVEDPLFGYCGAFGKVEL